MKHSFLYTLGFFFSTSGSTLRPSGDPCSGSARSPGASHTQRGGGAPGARIPAKSRTSAQGPSPAVASIRRHRSGVEHGEQDPLVLLKEHEESLSSHTRAGLV